MIKVTKNGSGTLFKSCPGVECCRGVGVIGIGIE